MPFIKFFQLIIIFCAVAALPFNSIPAGEKALEFVSTKDGHVFSDLGLSEKDTPAVRDFKLTGKNPYLGNAGMAKKGFRRYRYHGCIQCHGNKATGSPVMHGPNLTDENWRHKKSKTDKGMFETIWGGTPDEGHEGSMIAWGGQIPIDEILQIMAWVRSVYKGPPETVTWE